MTYYLILNNTLWDTTRDNASAFAWFRSWTSRGFNVGVKFLSDADEENACWLLDRYKEEKVAA